jgi:hypothetical protein
MKKLFLFLFIVGVMAGCSSSSSSASSSSAGPVSVLTYEISPDKTSYSEDEQFVITATITGDTVVNNKDVEASFNTSWSAGCGSVSSFPDTDATTYTYDAGPSGCTITVTAEPGYSYSVNGVEQITGTANFTITTP